MNEIIIDGSIFELSSNTDRSSILFEISFKKCNRIINNDGILEFYLNQKKVLSINKISQCGMRTTYDEYYYLYFSSSSSIDYYIRSKELDVIEVIETQLIKEVVVIVSETLKSLH